MNMLEIERLDKDDHRYFLDPDTWYCVFKIIDMSGKEFIDFDTTINGSNILIPYLKCERVCAVHTDYLGNIRPFINIGDILKIDWS